MIYFVLFTSFLLLTTSAFPAPRIIYSAVIYNAQDSPITCTVLWLEPNQLIEESATFTIRENKFHLVDGRTFDMGTWTAAGIINEIRCENLKITAPFDKVRSPRKYWEFHVETDKIVSVGASAYGS